jgi:hypothetical protein
MIENRLMTVALFGMVAGMSAVFPPRPEPTGKSEVQRRREQFYKANSKACKEQDAERRAFNEAVEAKKAAKRDRKFMKRHFT